MRRAASIHILDRARRGAEGALRQRCRHELVKVAVQHARGVGGVHAGAQVLDHLIGLQDVGADLMAPADVGLGGLVGGGLFLAFLQFDFVEPRAQHVPGLRPVLVLRAAGLTDYRNAGRNVREPYRGFGLVDVLPAGAARAHGVGTNVGFLDVDLDAVVDDGKYRDAGKRRVPARIGIEWRYPHQPMHAGFGLQPAIGVVTADLDGGGFDAGLFALRLLQIFDLEAVLLGPARIHAQQHRGPVLTLGAAGAGVHFEV